MAMIDVEQLQRNFGSLAAVNGISFSVEAGSIFGFLGPNGAGKTTTVKMLCTLLRPSGGQARVNDFDVVRQRDDVRRSIGVTFQDASLDDQLTAVENLRFHAMIYKVPRADRERRMAEALALVDLSDRAGSIVRTFSGGMKRRLELARSLMHRPAVLFLDEPTLGLDPQTRRRIWEFLQGLRRQHGLTLFLTTHYMEEAEACDRIAIIDHGAIIVSDTPVRLKERMGNDRVQLETDAPEALIEELRSRTPVTASHQGSIVSLSVPHGDQFVAQCLPQLRTPLRSLQVRKPTLEDVFVDLTGRAIRDEEAEATDAMQTFFRRKR